MRSADQNPETVLFAGAAVHDTIAMVDSMPGPDDRMVAEKIVRSGGGPAATAAVAAARLGVSVEIATVVGDDTEGRQVLEDLEAAGVGIRHAEIRRGASTAKSVAVVSRETDARCLLVRPGPTLHTIPPGYDWVHVDQDGYAAAAASRRDFGQLSVDDGNLIPGLDLGSVDLYVPTLHTLFERSGVTDPEAALNVVHKQGVRISLATNGRAGSVLRDDDASPVHVPALAIDEVVSTLGAGDAFHGALLAAVVLGRSAEQAARLASVCAALACRAVDGRGSLANLAEAEAHLSSLDPTVPLAGHRRAAAT